MDQLEFVPSTGVCPHALLFPGCPGHPWERQVSNSGPLGTIILPCASSLCSVKGFVWPHIHPRLWHEAVSTLTKRSGHMASICKPSSSAKLTCSVSQQHPQSFLSMVGTSSGLVPPRKPHVPSAWTTGWSRESLLRTPERTLLDFSMAMQDLPVVTSVVSCAVDTRFQRKGSALRSGHPREWQH